MTPLFMLSRRVPKRIAPPQTVQIPRLKSTSAALNLGDSLSAAIPAGIRSTHNSYDCEKDMRQCSEKKRVAVSLSSMILPTVPISAADDTTSEPSVAREPVTPTTSSSISQIQTRGKRVFENEAMDVTTDLSSIDRPSLKFQLPESARLQIAGFLHRELPIRLAQQVLKLEKTPYFKDSVNIRQVCDWYRDSFARLRSLDAPSTPEKEAEFADVVAALYDRHSHTLVTMARGAQEIRKALKQDMATFAEQTDIQNTLDEFYASRIGIRLLAAHYLAMRQGSDNPDTVGLFNRRTSPREVAQDAVEDASYMCTRTYGICPDVVIKDYAKAAAVAASATSYASSVSVSPAERQKQQHQQKRKGSNSVSGRKAEDLTFAYVPSHLKYILMEVLKNSMRATVELAMQRAARDGLDVEDVELPPVRIIISDGENHEDVCIMVQDKGSGIRRSDLQRVWSYLFTTADPDVIERLLSQTGGGTPVPVYEAVAPSSPAAAGKGVGSGDASFIGLQPDLLPSMDASSNSTSSAVSTSSSASSALRDFDVRSPLAGLGYGLPLARCYARHFGGDLKMVSMEGHGTDSYIHLPRLGAYECTHGSNQQQQQPPR